MPKELHKKQTKIISPIVVLSSWAIQIAAVPNLLIVSSATINTSAPILRISFYFTFILVLCVCVCVLYIYKFIPMQMHIYIKIHPPINIYICFIATLDFLKSEIQSAHKITLQSGLGGTSQCLNCHMATAISGLK